MNILAIASLLVHLQPDQLTLMQEKCKYQDTPKSLSWNHNEAINIINKK